MLWDLHMQHRQLLTFGLSYYVNVAAAATLQQWGIAELASHRKCHTGIAVPASRESKQRV